MKNKKRLVSALIILICIMGFTFGDTLATVRYNAMFPGSMTVEIDRSYRPTGGSTYMFGVKRIDPSNVIKIELGMYIGSTTICSRIYDGIGSTSRYYTLAGPSYVNFNGTNYNTYSSTIDIEWSYNHHY